MNPQSAEILERLLRANDLGTVLDTYEPSSAHLLDSLMDRLDKVAAEYHARFGGCTSFTPEALESESSRNPHKIRAFLQAMRRTRSPGMLVMVWRILQGLSVQEVKMVYQKRESFELVIVLTEPGAQKSALETYRSTDIFDVRLLRHFGVATAVNRPSFNGFFPCE
jgi:hypothetical protein